MLYDFTVEESLFSGFGAMNGLAQLEVHLLAFQTGPAFLVVLQPREHFPRDDFVVVRESPVLQKVLLELPVEGEDLGTGVEQEDGSG